MSTLVPKTTVANAILYENGMIRVDNVVFSYPHIDKVWKKEGDLGEAKFSVVGLLDKKTHEAAKTLVAGEMKRILGEAKLAIKADLKFLRDGDAGTDEDDPDFVNSYAGYWTLSARESVRPTARNNKGVKLDPVDDLEKIQELFYGGAKGHILIRPWLQDNKHGKRLNAGLVGIVFKEDGTPFGQARIDDSDAWGDVADADEGGGSAAPDDDEL